jgi:hypothetical protein
MKNLIKIFIALFFIIGSYFIGSYQANEKYSNQLNEVNKQLSISQSKINQLKDSINAINKLLIISTIGRRDTLKKSSTVLLINRKVNH